MKLKLLATTFIVVALLSSCLSGGSDNRTPAIQVARPVLTTGDTLNFWYTDEADVWLMDTISVGDTVQFYTVSNSFFNNITAFYIKPANDTVAEIILPPIEKLDSICSQFSDYEKGIFLFEGEGSILYFPFKYVALKPSKDMKLGLTVVSDAKFNNTMIVGGASNSASVLIKTPIK